ncbi:MAG: SDR family NAD(P)-dependent oxidoreductase [Rhizobiaceae bacterium]
MNVLVTGAASGLGRALTEELLRKGHKVVAVDRETQSLERLPSAYRKSCKIRFADLSNPNSLQRLLQAIGKERFDLVILNAGISATGKFEDIPAEAYDRLIAVNLRAPLILASSMVRNGVMNSGAKFVFISSLSNAVGYPGASVYAATKDALAVYARCVSKSFDAEKLGVLTVFPGPIRTDHAERHAPPGADAAQRLEPEKLARMVLKAARGRRQTYYPGRNAWIAAKLGRIMPKRMTRLMRKLIFEKLNDPVY